MLADLFRPMPLPRARAVLSLLFAGFAFLAISGAVSYSAASPDTEGLAGATYWAWFFTGYFVVLLGAALIGAFPRLARPVFKIGWLLLVSFCVVIALLVWNAQRPEAAPLVLGSWMLYLPAGAVLGIGLLFSELPEDWSEDTRAMEGTDGSA